MKNRGGWVLSVILLGMLPLSLRSQNTNLVSEEPNFYTIQKQFYDHWSYAQMETQKGWKQFKRWEWFWEPRVYPGGNFPNPMVTAKAFEEMQMFMRKSNTRSSGDWKSVGPSISSGTGIGRINFVCFHPADSNIIFIGAPSGGLWKTTDGGITWSTNTDNLPVIGFSSMVINPDNPNIMYLASSDGDAYDTYSIGVLKSTDGGKTWNTTGLNWDVTNTRTIRKLIMHPDNPDTLFAATSNGIWRTYNGGATWSRRHSSWFNDIEFKPGNPRVIYAAAFNSSYNAGGKFYRSTDGGNTFTEITGGFTGNANRIAIGITPADTSVVYVLASDFASANRSGFQGFYTLVPGVDTFKLLSSTPNILGWAVNGNDVKGQGWYDLEIAVSPTNKNEIYTGGVNIYKSIDGGANWTLNAHWYGGGGKPWVHADIHAMEFDPKNPNNLWVGSDGGIHLTRNGGRTYADLSQTLVTSQIYKIGISPTLPDLILMGLQDNGTKRYNSAWDNVIGGDGMECIIDPTNNDIMYGSLYYGDIRRSTNRGNDFTKIAGNGTKGIDEEGPWVTPFCLNPKDPKIIYAGFTNIWKNYNRGYDNWIKITNYGSTSGKFVDIAVSPSDTSVIYAGKAGVLYKTVNSGANWTAITGSLPLSTNSLTDIEIHPANSQIVWVTVSGYSNGNKVFMTTDGGGNWINISGSLPNLPANCIIYQKDSDFGLYVGMDVGVYYRDSSMTDWVPFSSGLPNVIINELEIYYGAKPIDSRIRAATYGRGLWESELYYTSNTPPVAAFSAKDTSICVGYSVKFQNTSTFSTQFKWYFPGGNPSTSTERNPFIQYNTHGVWNVTLVSSNAAGKDSVTFVNYIRVDSSLTCTYTMNPQFGGDVYTSCTGRLYDPGGTSVYPSSMNTYATIAPPGASAIFLKFNLFDTEKDYDQLFIYAGYGVTAPLYGVYSGQNLPNGGMIAINSPAVTLKFVSDQLNNKEGFEIDWQCLDSISPFAWFTVDSKTNCTGVIHFTDQSLNNPVSWNWDFGDGSTSNQQNPTHQYLSNGVFDVKLTIANTHGSHQSQVFPLEIMMPEPPSIPNISRCGAGTITLTAPGDDKVFWYDSLTGGSLLQTGNVFQTTVISGSKTYYVQKITNGLPQYVGPANNSIGTGGYYNGTQYLIFDVHKDINLSSILVFATTTTTNKRRIVIKNNSDSTLLDTFATVPSGPNRIYLNIDIPAGTDYKIITTDSSGLYRNNNGVSYPYSLEGLLTIKNSSAGGQYYYAYYNWEIREIGVCRSWRAPVVVGVFDNPPLASYTYSNTGLVYTFNNTSINGFSYHWDFGNGSTDTAISPVYQYPWGGVYKVKLKASNGCGTDSTIKNISVFGSVSDIGNSSKVRIYPNPGIGNFIISCDNAGIKEIKVFDVHGREIIDRTVSKSDVDNHWLLTLSSPSAGVYLVRLITTQGAINQIIMVQ